MTHRWRQLVLLVLALSISGPAGAALNSGVPTFQRGSFNLAEAYPGSIGSYDAAQGIANPQVFSGTCPEQPSALGATPGVLCLQRCELVLDVVCFAVIPEGETGPCVVQSYQLIKTIPGSIKCPEVYGALPQRYFQFGSGVRTWWSLNFTEPGTTFTLEVVSVCRSPTMTGIGNPSVHKDVWTWNVVADVNTMAYLIELMHAGAVSTVEVPCIVGEDMYDALRKARQRLSDALAITAESRLRDIGDAIFDMESLIIANCLFVEVLRPDVVFRGASQFGTPNFQPPGNLAPSLTIPEAGMAVVGIIDTREHPCCCKLLVDLEWITRQNRLSDRLLGL